MIPLQPPRYEVLNARPTLGESIKEFTIFEKLTVPALTAASAAGGFAFARPRGVRHPSMILAGAVGFFGATAHGMIQAQSRLMGYSPNAVSEMKKSVVDPNDESMDYLKQYATRFVPRQEVEAAE